MNSKPRLGIVTGGASGIGRAMALKLARDGWHVCVTDVNPEGGEETVRLINDRGYRAQFEKLDVTSPDDWSRLRDRLQNEFEHLGLLVNNAGVCAGGEFEKSSLETWDWVQEINVRGAVLGCHTMVPWLKQNPHRSYILNMSSVAGVVYSPRMASYNASKAALLALSETLYHELKPFKIQVTAVCPWFCNTNLLEQGRFNQDSEKAYARQQMQYTLVTPERIASKALSAMYWGRPVRVIGGRANVIWYMKRYVPSLAWKAVDLLYYFTIRAPESSASRGTGSGARTASSNPFESVDAHQLESQGATRSKLH